MLQSFGETLCKGNPSKEMRVLRYCFVFYENKLATIVETSTTEGYLRVNNGTSVGFCLGDEPCYALMNYNSLTFVSDLGQVLFIT